MGLKIADLLKWRTSITLKDENDNVLLDEETKEPIVVWLRIIGDEDLQETFKKARAASSLKRRQLADKESTDFLGAVEPIRTGTREEIIEVIKAARTSNLPAEAQSVVVRPELPELEEFAVNPDAPTLEEQERHDAAIQKVDDEYNKAIGEYQLSRITELEATFEGVSLEDLRLMAETEVNVILAQAAYITEMLDQKLWRAVYTDKACRERAFDSVEEWRQTDSGIKDQLVRTYLNLEQNPDDIKN